MDTSKWFKGMIIITSILVIMFIIPLGITVHQNEKPKGVKKTTFEKEFKVVYQELIKEKTNQEKINKNKIDKLSEFIYKNNYRVDRKTSKMFARFIFENTKNPILVVAVITRESNFNPMAKSRVGALGMGQIRPSVWLSYLSKSIPQIKRKKDLYNWKLNILATDCILDKLLKIHENNLSKTLRHYVGGNHRSYIKDVKRLTTSLKKCI